MSHRPDLVNYVLKRAQELADFAEPSRQDDANAALSLARHIAGNSFLTDATACMMLHDLAVRQGWDRDLDFHPGWHRVDPPPRERR
jgi:hypothetical protein